MIDSTRWKLAQKQERKAWENFTYDEMAKKQFNLKCISVLEKHLEIKDQTKILEIGASPVCILTNINRGQKYGLDPLMDHFKEHFKMDPEITWEKGVGEQLPFPDSTFDVVVISNTLDHAEDPKKVIEEIFRVLKKEGHVLLTTNIFSPKICSMINVLEKINCGDPCHPHHFSYSAANDLFNKFTLLEEHTIISDAASYPEQKTPWQKFKKYASEEGIMFAIRLSIFYIAIRLWQKFSVEAKYYIFLFKKFDKP